jgi:response regulator of citrate/malate metabolism
MSVSVITVSNDEWNEVKTAALQTREMVSTLIDKQGEYLTPKEVCEMLKIGRATYERYIGNSKDHKAILQTYQLQGAKRKYVKRTDVLQMLTSGNY